MSGRVIVGIVLLSLVLLPALSVAVDDLSASPGARHEAGMRHQPTRGWRTLPSAVGRPVYVPPATRLQTIEVREPEYTPPLLVRTPFVPPRG
ncbi:MAG TPA: hypothetical protein VN646_18245 [Candidatus Acidoferrum sp.]|jgi:hypothetical protein|nr:hypothetical protein [Candidatus Acidoferrum sp.]